MARIKWADLPSKATTHCVVLRVPGEIPSGKQTLDLMARYMRSLHTGWTYALTINRQSGAHQILCGFPRPNDAEAFAKAVNAQSQLSDGWATMHVITADEACFARIQAAAPPARKRARSAQPDPRASRLTARMRRRNYESF